MEQNLPIISKKIWKIIRVVYFMLRKGISKAKLLSALTLMMKRGKLAGKEAIHNLLHHHHHHHAAATSRHPFPITNEYEFSCSNSPAAYHHHPIFHFSAGGKRRGSASAHSPPPPEAIDVAALAAALEMFHSAAASPALPGFGPSPMVRQLRITDSPFPIRDVEDDDHVVDEAAEEFIMRFYRDLKKQNASPYFGFS